MMQKLIASGLCLLSIKAYSFTWQDLWHTPNQQGQALLNQGQFQKAALRFEREDWRAVAAFRAGHYEEAARLFELQGDEDGFYNQGNALAHMGLYEQALQAYDKTLAINPEHEDARFNRKLVEELLKKDKEKQEQHNQEQNKQDKQDKQNSNTNAKSQSSTSDKKDKQSSESQKTQDASKDSSSSAKEAESHEDKAQKEQKNSAEQDVSSQDKNKQQNKAPKPNQDQASEAASGMSNEEQESQQANQQWLRLIPDDPGGLLREKFLRDHLKRQRGW